MRWRLKSLTKGQRKTRRKTEVVHLIFFSEVWKAPSECHTYAAMAHYTYFKLSKTNAVGKITELYNTMIQHPVLKPESVLRKFFEYSMNDGMIMDPIANEGTNWVSVKKCWL